MTANLNTASPRAKRILLIAANPAVSPTTGWPIGFWAAELTHPYWAFTEAGYQVDSARVEGEALAKLDSAAPDLWPETLQKALETDIAERRTIVVDPMLATGNSVSAAVKRLKEKGAKDIRLVTLLSAPEGIMHFHEQHPDVPVFTAAVDSHLNSHGYIVPGLGDAGDRMFGTK